MCGERIGALEATLNRLAEMVEMLVAARGLASLALRLAVEKHKGRMAREWDKSMSQASEKAKVEAVLIAAEKWARKRVEQEQRAEEACMQPEKAVQVKKTARLAGTAERDRMVEATRVCTDGPAMVADAEKVVEAARVAMTLEREVVQSAAPVEIGGWQIEGGRKRKRVQVVSQLGRPVDGERRRSLQGDVTKVQALVGVANMAWGVVASPYTVHMGDKVLWTVRGVDVDMDSFEVVGIMVKNLEAI